MPGCETGSKRAWAKNPYKCSSVQNNRGRLKYLQQAVLTVFLVMPDELVLTLSCVSDRSRGQRGHQFNRGISSRKKRNTSDSEHLWWCRNKSPGYRLISLIAANVVSSTPPSRSETRNETRPRSFLQTAILLFFLYLHLCACNKSHLHLPGQGVCK